jgi:RNA polymerase sigma factor for flagellar operon FliA
MAPASRYYRSLELGPEGGADERERTIIQHLPQVWLIARRIHARLPESVALDDLVSAGTIGLIAAIDHYKAEHQVKLKTYAEYKIRGAILDSLRELDFASRQKRRKARQVEAAIVAAEQKLHRTSNEEEIAAELGLGGDGEGAELEGFGPSFAEELEELAQEIETGEGEKK